MIMIGLVGFLTVFGTFAWLSHRGLHVDHASCGWDENARTYEVKVAVHNQERMFKLVKLIVQGRFRPRHGQQWPNRILQARYEAVNRPLAVRLSPAGDAMGAARFFLPGIEGFQCTAVTEVAGQERFAKEPDPDVLQAMESAF